MQKLRKFRPSLIFAVKAANVDSMGFFKKKFAFFTKNSPSVGHFCYAV
jgi:hypothetical protein